jgi:hypothetical protein
MDTINGLYVETDGNAFIVHAEDHEGSDKVVELNRALHVIDVIKGRIISGKYDTGYKTHRFYVETASGSLMSRSETLQAIAFIQPRLHFSEVN